jgi:methylated-DNA-[protein]-cysteine S-methyltransferase
MNSKLSSFSKDDSLHFSFLESPVDLIGLAGSSKGLIRLKLGLKDPSPFIEYIETQFPGSWSEKASPFKEIKSQLRLYFKSKIAKFDFKADPRVGTPFQKKVWAGLRKIPFGQTRSYAWLAQHIDNPKACRAVGNANGKNPISILIPCHRVIRETGALGGYTGGISYKQFLLNLEQKSNGTL